MKTYQELLAELKRRNVFKVAWWYGIVSFGVLQAADLALPRLGLPDWTVTFMLAMVLLLFPVALMLAWAFEMTAEGVRKTEAPAPGEIEAIVAEPLSKRWPAGLLALIGVLALVGSTWWLARRTAPEADATRAAEGRSASDVRFAIGDPADDARPSLAVLPFADMSPESDQAYFSDGITEEILGTLAKVRELKVAARTSAFASKGRQLDLRELGDSLGVSYLIEGSVRKSGDQLRITAQLIDAADGTQLWSESYDRTMDDVFAIQSEIARAIASELRVPLGLDDAAGLVTPTADLEAYDLYLAGRGRLRERGTGVVEAIRLFEAAVARDSGWAPAWAGLAEAREISVWYPEAWGEDMPADPFDRRDLWMAGIRSRLGPAEDAARHALALDPNNASALVALGSVHRDRRDWAAAEASYRRAVELDPDNAEAFHQYGEMLAATGRAAEAVPVSRRAVALDPAAIRRGMYGWVLMADDRTEEGVEVLGPVIAEAENRMPILTRTLFEALVRLERYEEADSLAEAALGVDERQAVRAARARDASLMPASVEPRYWMWVDRPDRAIEAYRAIGDDLAPLDIYRLWYPDFDPIRDQPEMEPVLRRANLENGRARRTPRGENPSTTDAARP